MELSWTKDDLSRITEAISATLGRQLPCPIQAAQGPGLTVDWSGAQALITAEDRTALARGCFLLIKAHADGQTSLHIHQTRHIASCGVQLDCSRGAVMTVEGVKRYINCLAALGLNLLMLYTEDTYTVPEFPYFGHGRGRYTPEEMCEINAYAASMGVELVPCIQTLAHLEHYLDWNAACHLQDTSSCLLIDEDETYTLIEACIRAMRSYVTTDRIHIGMDEAHGVGLARYFAKHGLVDRFEMLRRHLDKVVAICSKYGFRPMMWSDMFFRLGSKTDEYFDMEANVPQAIIDRMPDVDMVYWDYYHTEESAYDFMMKEHARLGRNTVFAGGIWTWSGFLPHVDWTDATMYPALRVSARHNVQTAYATMWGDDGNETSHFLALSQLPIFSEFCWLGDAATKEDVAQAGQLLTGLHPDSYKAFSYFYDGPRDERTGKGLVYCDPLFDLLPGKPDLETRIQRYKTGKALLAPQLDRPECRYANALFDLVIGKAQLILDIRAAYAAQDKPALAQLAEEAIPALIADYETFEDEHRAIWHANYKRPGWEIFPNRYGAAIGRLRDAARVLLDYASGTLPAIDELDLPDLDPNRKYGVQYYSVYVSPQM